MVEVRPDATISIGKFGVISTNQLLYRPYNLTFEILDTPDGPSKTKLRVIPANELNTEILSSSDLVATESNESTNAQGTEDDGGVQYDIVGEDGSILIRNNRMTVDDSARQKLTHIEIEALKRVETGGGKEIIAKILENHTALGEKTDFSLQKYTVRKAKKYLRRVTVYPVDVGSLCDFIHAERDMYRIMELREDTLSVLMSWANVRQSGGRWLVIDDTGGLIVAAIAERLGILHYNKHEEEDNAPKNDADLPKTALTAGEMSTVDVAQDTGVSNGITNGSADHETKPDQAEPRSIEPRKPPRAKDADHMAATTNTITLLHSASQPNTSLLAHFGFPPEKSPTTHPLYSHLKTISWLALLSPEDDPALAEPPPMTTVELSTLSAGKKSSYFRKRRRWERLNKVVQDTRAGEFDGLIIASESMVLSSALQRLVPLVRGGGQIVAYSPTPEALTQVMDLYSRDRRAAFTKRVNEELETKERLGLNPKGPGTPDGAAERDLVIGLDSDGSPDTEEFPVNPTLVLSPMMQTVRARRWQVLPGRTHPIMTGKGGAEGYIFSGTRVIPIQGRVEARGRFGKAKKKPEANEAATSKSGEKRRRVEES